MRILYFSSRELWPVNTGARLRDYHFARELARRARVTYLGLRNPADPPAVAIPAETGLERSAIVDKDPNFSPVNLLRGMAGPLPITVLNNWSARIRDEITRTLNEGDVFGSAQVEGVHLVQYIPVLRASRGRPAIVADWHNIESEIMWRFAENTGLAKGIYARRTAKLIEDMELRLLRECDVHVVTSARERAILKARVPDARIEVVGNGVDVPHHADDQLRAACERAGVRADGEQRDIIFVGSMDYHANIEAVMEFAETMWPGMHAQHPELRFVVVGRNPPAQVRQLAERPSVAVTGTVDDVRPWYRGALATVVPLRTGSGTRLKILEAMAAGVPVVSTRLGAEGLDVTDGVNILLAETAGEFVAAVESLSRSAERRAAVAEAGRKLVREKYDWGALGERLFEIHRSAGGAGRAS